MRTEARRELEVQGPSNYQHGVRIALRVNGEEVAKLTPEEFRELLRLMEATEVK